jgi:hypothetical protein
MANTFELISSYTATGTVSSIDFTSIASTWTDLVVKTSIRETSSGGTDYVWLQFNGDTSTSNYKSLILRGNGSTTASSLSTGEGKIRAGITDTGAETANTFSNCEIYIPNAFGSAQKSLSCDWVAENNATNNFMGFTAGLWTGTSAITSIKLFTSSSIGIYSTAYLYGVKNA